VGGETVASWEAEGGSISMGVEEVALVHLEVGGLVVVGGGLRKGRKLPSFLEGVAFWGAMVEGLWCKSQERVVVVTCWKVQCTLFTRVGLRGRATCLSVGGGPSC